MKKENLVFELTLKKLTEMYPDKTMLNIEETAKAYGLKNPQTIYNALRNPDHPFPRPVKRCGRWYWNIVKIAEDMIS